MTPEFRRNAGVALLNSGLTCARQGGPPGHMWLWWIDVDGHREYRGYWPNAEGIDDRSVLEDPARLQEYLKKSRAEGEILRDRMAQIVTEHRQDPILRKTWSISERKLTTLAYNTFIPKHTSQRAGGRYAVAIKGCDNCVSWVVKRINETVGDSFTIVPFWPPLIKTAAVVIFGEACPEVEPGR